MGFCRFFVEKQKQKTTKKRKERNNKTTYTKCQYQAAASNPKW